MEQLTQDQGDDAAKIMPTSVLKPLHKIISEHKDVVKIVIQLNSIISTFKVDIQGVLDQFTKYSELWTQVRHTWINLVLLVGTNISSEIFRDLLHVVHLMLWIVRDFVAFPLLSIAVATNGIGNCQAPILSS